MPVIGTLWNTPTQQRGKFVSTDLCFWSFLFVTVFVSHRYLPLLHGQGYPLTSQIHMSIMSITRSLSICQNFRTARFRPLKAKMGFSSSRACLLLDMVSVSPISTIWRHTYLWAFVWFKNWTDFSIVAGLAPNSGLLGHSLEDAALVDQWIHLVETEVALPNNIIRFMLIGKMTPYNKPVFLNFSACYVPFSIGTFFLGPYYSCREPT